MANPPREAVSLYSFRFLRHYDSMSRRRVSIRTALQGRIPAGAKVLVAVSGGRDSVVLLHGLLQVQRLMKLSLEVCHIDHGFRSSSGDDALFVESLCRERGVLCHVVRLPPKPEGENLEAWARQSRYREFSRVLQDRGLDLVVTAHNANDVAETLLMRLIANKELNSIEEFDAERRCLRPLMGISRDQIDRYVVEHQLSYVEDPSNAELSFVRNRVRHRLLPLLIADFDSSVVWTLSEQAQAFAEDCDALQEVARHVSDRIGPVEESSSSWLARCRAELQGVPAGVQWRVVQFLFSPLVGFPIGRNKARAIQVVLEGQRRSVLLDARTELTWSGSGVRCTARA